VSGGGKTQRITQHCGYGKQLLIEKLEEKESPRMTPDDGENETDRERWLSVVLMIRG